MCQLGGGIETCIGPLLPTTRTLFTLLLTNLSNAYSVTSVPLSLSTPLNNILATSSATFPCPMTTASSAFSSPGSKLRFSGLPLYHPTKSLAEYIPLSVSSPGIFNFLSLDAPYERTRAL